MNLVCAYCSGRGKGVTLVQDKEFYVCQDLKGCEGRINKLSPSDRTYLASERLKIMEANNADRRRD